jgi:hypothetical protein
MVALSHLVVHGRVVSRRGETKTLLPWSEDKGRHLTKEEAGEEFAELALTVTTVELDEVLRRGKGTKALAGRLEAGAHVDIEQRGGELACGCIEEPTDDPLLATGEEAVFFLTGSGDAGRYHIVGGWQGRFVASSSGLTALAASVHPGSELSSFVDLPLEEMRARVNAVSAPALAVDVSPFSMLPSPGESPAE